MIINISHSRYFSRCKLQIKNSLILIENKLNSTKHITNNNGKETNSEQYSAKTKDSLSGSRVADRHKDKIFSA